MASKTQDALQWFYSRGAVAKALSEPGAPTAHMMTRLQRMGLIHMPDPEGWRLTDKGRQQLWEAEQ
jgi:Mn-dependent DtxR family transcriptional regulator